MTENLNLIFGRNLRKLCEEHGTFSEVSRRLGISRVQLSRFIKGESFPKPNQLAQMTTLFGVDARIFTSPLDQLRKGAGNAPVSPLTEGPSITPGIERYLGAQQPVPDGLHITYRPSFTLRGFYVAVPLLVRRTNRGTTLRAVDPVPYGTRRSDSGAISRRSYRGLAMATPDGMVMHFYGTGDMPFLTTAHFASRSFFAATGTFRGTLELFRPPHPEEFRRVPILLHILQQKTAVLLPIFRRGGLVRLDDIPERFHDYLSPSLAA